MIHGDPFRTARVGEVATVLGKDDRSSAVRESRHERLEERRVLMSVELQSHEATLSGQQADDLVGRVIGACRDQLSAELLS